MTRRGGARRLVLALLSLFGLLTRAAAAPPQVKELRVVLLSTMLADRGRGEWGFSALVEADGHRVLFDTGAAPDTVLHNARVLGVDLGGVEDVVLSHNHGDHTGGLLALRRALRGAHPRALSRAHVATGIFYPRPAGSSSASDGNPLTRERAAYEASGGRFVVHAAPAALLPGLWLTGPVPRVFPERNYGALGQVQTPAGLVADVVPEDQALVIDTARGLVVLSGCGHAGIVNTLDLAQRQRGGAPVYAVLGGLHLYQASDETLRWTGGELRARGVQHLLGAHCTGIEAVFALRRELGLARAACVVGAVGASFRLDRGIDALRLAR